MTNTHAPRPRTVPHVQSDQKGDPSTVPFDVADIFIDVRPSVVDRPQEPHEFPSELRTSLLLQIRALTLVALIAFAVEGHWLSAAAVIGVLALLVIRKLLSTGSFGIWLGAMIGTVAAIVAFAGLTLMSPLQQTGLIAASTGLLLLQLHYMVALLAPATRRFFAQRRSPFVS